MRIRNLVFASLIISALVACTSGSFGDLSGSPVATAVSNRPKAKSASAVSTLKADLDLRQGVVSSDLQQYLTAASLRNLTVDGAAVPPGTRIDIFNDGTYMTSCTTSECDCVFGIQLQLNPIGAYSIDISLHGRSDVTPLRVHWFWMPNHY